MPGHMNYLLLWPGPNSKNICSCIKTYLFLTPQFIFDKFRTVSYLNNLFQIYFLHDKKTPVEYFLKYLIYSILYSFAVYDLLAAYRRIYVF